MRKNNLADDLIDLPVKTNHHHFHPTFIGNILKHRDGILIMAFL